MQFAPHPIRSILIVGKANGADPRKVRRRNQEVGNAIEEVTSDELPVTSKLRRERLWEQEQEIPRMRNVFVMKQDFLGAGCVHHFATDRATIIQTVCALGCFRLLRFDNIARCVAALGVLHRKLLT